MDTAHIEGLIGMLTVLGILVLLVLPSVLGIAHDRRIDRQIREAERARGEAEGLPAERPARRQRYLTTTVTHHS
jgi:F0F1-type ATP synthase membrane subunit b/b'